MGCADVRRKEMLALALTLTVLAAPPRGFAAAHSVELVTQVDNRLAKWLTHGGDRKALLATPKELEAWLGAAAVKEPEAQPAQAPFTPARVLIEYAGKRTTLHYFDAEGARCEVPLWTLGTEARPRYVLLGGPRTDTLPLEKVLERRSEAMMVFAEKKDGAWFTGTLPKPPPPDCTGVIKNALKTIFTAQKAYFAEKDAYSNSLTKLGVDAKALGITSAKITVKGAAPAQTFTIQIGLKGGLMTMDDKGGVSIVADCSP